MSTDRTRRIHIWSGPRNVSTALMYSFAQRSDTRVVDEPFYGHYLRVTDAVHPGTDEFIDQLDPDGERVIREVIFGECEAPLLVFKQMAHHRVSLSSDFLGATEHVFLIRDPRDMLPSLVHQIPNPTLRDTGLGDQSALWNELVALGIRPPVLDSRELLLDPEGVLRLLCDHLDIPFEPNMLEWEAGPRPEDGPWAPYWYHNVHRFTGFAPYRPKDVEVPAEQATLLEECLQHYEPLAAEALSTRTK